MLKVSNSNLKIYEKFILFDSVPASTILGSPKSLALDSQIHIYAKFTFC